MCSEQRATFQRCEMDIDGKVTTHYSVTLSRVQAWSAVILAICGIVAALFGGVRYIRASVADVAHDVFEDSLDSYHTVMRPQLYQKVDETIDKKVLEHKIAVEKPFEERLDAIENRLTVLEASIPKAIDRNTASIDRLDAKMDRILERLN